MVVLAISFILLLNYLDLLVELVFCSRLFYADLFSYERWYVNADREEADLFCDEFHEINPDPLNVLC